MATLTTAVKNSNSAYCIYLLLGWILINMIGPLCNQEDCRKYLVLSDEILEIYILYITSVNWWWNLCEFNWSKEEPAMFIEKETQFANLFTISRLVSYLCTNLLFQFVIRSKQNGISSLLRKLSFSLFPSSSNRTAYHDVIGTLTCIEYSTKNKN
jgi:hypothetical protein